MLNCEAVAENNDELMEKYLGDEEISIDELKAAIRKATTDVEFYSTLWYSIQNNCSINA